MGGRTANIGIAREGDEVMDFSPNDVSGTPTHHEMRRLLDANRTPTSGFRPDELATLDTLQSGSWRFTRITGNISGAASQSVLPVSSSLGEWKAERDPLDAASEDRIRLLARKFEGGSNREEIARLEILNARLDRLAPQVTEQDIQFLEHMAERMERLQAEADHFDALRARR